MKYYIINKVDILLYCKLLIAGCNQLGASSVTKSALEADGCLAKAECVDLTLTKVEDNYRFEKVWRVNVRVE